MTEPFGQSEKIVMLQRTKIADTSRLSVVHAESQPAPQPAAPEAKVETPEIRTEEAPLSRKAKITGAFKANRKRVLMGVALAVLAGVGWTGFNYAVAGRYMVSTDDAYVKADATTLAAKVAGYVSAIDVNDNTYVHTGDVIARIDDGDYKLAVNAARDKVATQQATVARIGRQIEAQQALVTQAEAQLVSSQAQAKRASLELDRQQKLAGNAYASQQTLEAAQANRDQTEASVAASKASVAAALANVDVLKAQQTEAARTVDELKTAQAKAERDQSFTEIRAPIDGVIGNRAVKTGDFVQTGQRIASVVPLDDVYIDANFKETQLSRLQPGQPVAVDVDAIPGHEIKGEVLSVSPASGSTFSLLPPDNATGNFTKIVQRIAVRIQVPANVAARRQLRPGMSVVVNVNTKPTALASRNDAQRVADTANTTDSHSTRW
ncbi:MAG TPA: HlyD family secretion protein [Pseudolabrys sp.]|jgi:membrane fusion protein (multidrug efflux system)